MDYILLVNYYHQAQSQGLYLFQLIILDYDEFPTYTTLNPCSFDELDVTGKGK